LQRSAIEDDPSKRGRLVKQFFINANMLKQIAVGNFKNGLYLIRIENENEVITKKILIDN
jgi:hypothetical protein